MCCEHILILVRCRLRKVAALFCVGPHTVLSIPLILRTRVRTVPYLKFDNAPVVRWYASNVAHETAHARVMSHPRSTLQHRLQTMSGNAFSRSLGAHQTQYKLAERGRLVQVIFCVVEVCEVAYCPAHQQRLHPNIRPAPAGVRFSYRDWSRLPQSKPQFPRVSQAWEPLLRWGHTSSG